jgi:hypothetical protein
VRSEESKKQRAEYSRRYKALHRERLKALRCTGRPTGRPRECFLEVDDPRERRRLHSARQVVREGASRVMRRWRWEASRLTVADVVFDVGLAVHGEWIDSLDDELPPGVDLSAALWGSAPRARDGALPRYRDVP